MRILLLSDEPRDPGMGGPKVALKLQAALQDQGHLCDVLFRPDLGAGPHAPRLRLAVAPALAWRAAARAPRRSGVSRYDVIEAAGAEGWLLATGWGRRAGRGAAIVVRSHGLEHRFYRELLADAHAGRLHKPWTRRLWYPAVRLPQVEAALRRADRVIVPNPADLEFIAAQGWQSAARMAVIPHGIDAGRWSAAPPATAARGAGLLFCGWWTSSKGVDDLARAHARLLHDGLALPLTLLGVGEAAPGDPTRLPAAEEQRVRSAFAPGSQPWLTLTPRTRDEDAVFAAYRRHDIIVCPSTSEGFGMVILEALSQRLPVVCSTAAGAAALLRDGREALLTPPRNPVALAAALSRLWRDPSLRHALAEAGHTRTQALTWPHVARQTLAVYQDAWLHHHTVLSPYVMARAAC